MKRFESDHYCARDKDGTGYLMLRHDDTVEAVRAEIDWANERAARLGYRPDQYLITHEEIYWWNDGNGTFMRRETHESVVEIYPEVL